MNTIVLGITKLSRGKVLAIYMYKATKILILYKIGTDLRNNKLDHSF